MSALGASGRYFHLPHQSTIRRKKQQPISIQIKATDGHDPRQVGRQFVIDRRSALWIALSREQAGRLVIAEQAGGRGFLHWIAVHCDAVKRFQQRGGRGDDRSEEHTSELQSLMRISYAVFCLKKNIIKNNN